MFREVWTSRDRLFSKTDVRVVPGFEHRSEISPILCLLEKAKLSGKPFWITSFFLS